MRNLRQISIKNCPEYFFNSMTNIMKLDTSLLSVNQISFTNTDAAVYKIEYIKNFDDLNPLYLVFNDVDASFECINENKYLVFAPIEKNREALENYKELWNEFKKEIRTIREIEPFEYEKDVMRIKFESDYGFPLGEILNIPVCIIIARSVFEETGKYYPQVHLKDCFLECDYAYDSYVCCKTPLKSINCTNYGLILSEKRFKPE